MTLVALPGLGGCRIIRSRLFCLKNSGWRTSELLMDKWRVSRLVRRFSHLIPAYNRRHSNLPTRVDQRTRIASPRPTTLKFQIIVYLSNKCLSMTPREQQILSLIKGDPLISQAALAGKLGISRSAVAGHIMNLTNKGHYQGPGLCRCR